MIKNTFFFSIIVISIVLFSFTSQKNSNSINYFEKTNNLKAVLVVGPQEDGTGSAIAKMNRIAKVLIADGVEVKKFYNKKAVWADIVQASNDANFFIYSGHGNLNGNNKDEGILCLYPHTIYYNQIKKELHLAKNSIVIFQSVCYGAGSSAGDDKDIGLNEAKRRVSAYAGLFFDCGASAYFAINTTDGAYEFLNGFFSGENIHKCFVNSTSVFYDIEIAEESKIYSGKNIAVASSDWGGTTTRTTYTNGVKKVEKIPTIKSYSIAYIAKKDYCIDDLKGK